MSLPCSAMLSGPRPGRGRIANSSLAAIRWAMRPAGPRGHAEVYRDPGEPIEPSAGGPSTS